MNYKINKFWLTKTIFLNQLRYLYFLIKSKNLSITEAHFNFWSDPNHLNRKIFETTIIEMGFKPTVIVETGTAAWGTNSTRLWDAYIRKYGGSLVTIDLRSEPSAQLAGQLSKISKCEVSDSVTFLEKNQHINADLYFLDSWDVDWSKPHESALHGKAEFAAISDRLNTGALVLIDDTPISKRFIPEDFHSQAESYYDDYKVWPGKGALVLKEILETDKYEVICHEYALLFRKKF